MLNNSLQFSDDLGALDVFNHLIGPRVQICEIIIQLFHGCLPGALPVLRHTSCMAAWFDKGKKQHNLTLNLLHKRVKTRLKHFGLNLITNKTVSLNHCTVACIDLFPVVGNLRLLFYLWLEIISFCIFYIVIVSGFFQNKSSKCNKRLCARLLELHRLSK